MKFLLFNIIMVLSYQLSVVSYISYKLIYFLLPYRNNQRIKKIRLLNRNNASSRNFNDDTNSNNPTYAENAKIASIRAFSSLRSVRTMLNLLKLRLHENDDIAGELIDNILVQSNGIECDLNDINECLNNISYNNKDSSQYNNIIDADEFNDYEPIISYETEPNDENYNYDYENFEASVQLPDYTIDYNKNTSSKFFDNKEIKALEKSNNETNNSNKINIDKEAIDLRVVLKGKFNNEINNLQIVNVESEIWQSDKQISDINYHRDDID